MRLAGCLLALGVVLGAVSARAATITFDDIVQGVTSYGYDGDGDGVDDVIFSTPDPLGFNTVGPGPNVNYVNEPGIEGTSQIPESLRVDFEVGAIGGIQFGFVLCTSSETSGVTFRVYDADDNLLSETFTLATYTPTASGQSSFPEGLVEVTFPGRAEYATFTFTNTTANDPGSCGRYIIDNLTGLFGSSEVIDENPPLCGFDPVTASDVATGFARDERPSEDVNGNGFLDPGEDLNANGKIDTDFGVASIALVDALSNNVSLSATLAAGDPTATFSVSLVDANAPGAAAVLVTDLVGNVCTATVALTGCVPDSAPTITLLDAASLTGCREAFVDPGAIAVDSCGTALTVTSEGTVNENVPGSYTITYRATDAEGNSASATREVDVIDDLDPVVTINGLAELVLTCPALYTELGVTVLDACDPAPSVVVSGAVNIELAGAYTITYTVADASGNQVVRTRQVQVPSADVDCNDNNPCTDNVCNRGVGCVNPPNTASCNDNNACTTGDVCAAGSCAGVDTSATACDDQRACTADACAPNSGCVNTVVAAGTVCGAYLCDGSSGDCPTTCDADVDCADGHYCDAAGACVPEEDNGEPCGRAAQCESGLCVDGVCCDGVCGAACEACNLVGQEGACSPVADGTASTCAPYLCDGVSGECPGLCVSDADCQAGSYCDASGACVPVLDDGENCDRNGQCMSGFCSEGVCTTVAIDAPEDGDVVGPLPTVTGRAPPGSTVTLTVGEVVVTTTADSNGDWTYTFTTALPEGPVTITATVGEESASVEVTVDATAPELAVLEPTDGTTRADGDVTVSGTSEPGATVVVTLGEQSVTLTADENGAWSHTFADLGDGVYTVIVTATDAVGNAATETVSFTVDTSAPSVVITAPAEGAFLSNPDVTVTGTAEAPVVLSGIGAARSLVAGTFSTTYEDLADGTYTVVATATDAGGLSATDSVTFTVDTVPPVVAITTPTGEVDEARPTISGTGEPGATVTVTVDGEVVGTTTVREDGTWSVTLSADLADGEHNISVTATDRAGNTATDSRVVTVKTVDDNYSARGGGGCGAGGEGLLGLWFGAFALLRIGRRRRD